MVPVNKVIRLQLTSADVIHAWALPAAGVKMDAVPGRYARAGRSPEKPIAKRYWTCCPAPARC